MKITPLIPRIENADVDGDNESVISDYSEIGDAFKEHLTTSFSEGELKLIAKHELTSGDFRLDSNAGDSSSATSLRRSIQDIDSQLADDDTNKQCKTLITLAQINKFLLG